MKNNASIWIWLTVGAVCLSSCRARFYTPNRNPVPFFKEKGDVYVDGSTNIFNKYDLTLGYAITNGIGAYAGYAGASISGKLDSVEYSKYRYSGNMMNFGLGYFLSENISGNFRFEVFADYGSGNYRNSATGTKHQFFNGNYQRIGIMPNIGYSGGNFTLAYSARLSQLTFSNASLSDSTFWKNDIARLNRKPEYTLLEQSLTFRFGFEHIKFQAQLGAYAALNASETDDAVQKFNASVMVGIILNTNIFGGGKE
jgi:hypothetical protein